MDFIDYRERLGIGLDNSELEDLFFNRLFNVLDGFAYMGNQISKDEYFNFCKATGYPMVQGIGHGEGWELTMNILRKNSTSLKEFLPYYMFFINVQKDNSYKTLKKSDLKNLLCACLKESHIPYEIYKDKNNYFIFPYGAKELDDELISNSFLWLKEYPLTRKAWISALKSYSEDGDENASEIADKFRKALERFFQEFFNTNKTLENLKSEYGLFLSNKGVPGEIRNNFEKLLESYTNYMNNYAKHHDGASKNILEYIMYQTANLIRLLITLKNEN